MTLRMLRSLFLAKKCDCGTKKFLVESFRVWQAITIRTLLNNSSVFFDVCLHNLIEFCVNFASFDTPI